MTTTIHIAENDLQGNRCGMATNISFENGDGNMVEFSTFPNMDGVPCEHQRIGGKREIRLLGKCYQQHGCTEWLGNMMWNGYSMDIETALRLLNDIMGSSEWSIHDDNVGIPNCLPITAKDMGWRATETTEPAREAGINQLSLF